MRGRPGIGVIFNLNIISNINYSYLNKNIFVSLAYFERTVLRYIKLLKENNRFNSIHPEKMDVYETDDISERLWAYFRRRNYMDGDVFVKPDLNVSSDDMSILCAVDKDSSFTDSVTVSNVIPDISQAEIQYAMLHTWIMDMAEEACQQELSPILMPLLCHIYLDSISANHRHLCAKFLKRYLTKPLFTEEWTGLIEQCLNVHSTEDIENQPLANAFRNSKFELKMAPRSTSLLRHFLANKNLHLMIQVLHDWFEIETLTEDMANYEEDCNQLPVGLTEEEDCEEEYDEDDYIDINDSEMEQLVNEIQKMRSQPTPPPPLLLYTAHRTEGIVCGRVSGDGKLAATGDQQSEVRVWGLGETKMTPQLNPSYFSGGQISAFTEPLLDLQEQNDKQWWSLRGHNNTVYDVAFLADCDYLISVSFDTTMRLWKMSDFSCASVYRGHNCPLWGAAVSPVHNLVATASSDKTARIWSLDRTYPLRIMAGHIHDVLCAAFHPNGSYLATGSADRTVRLWSVTDGSLVRVLGHPEQGSVETVAFSPNGQYAASAGSDSHVWLWDLAEGSLVYQLGGHTSRIVDVDWSHDGSTVSACSYDGTVLLWSLDCDMSSGGSKPKKYMTKCSTLLSLQYSTKNTLVAVGLS